MNLTQLEVLVATVDHGSMTEAAEVIGLTQSAVSYALSKLEAELGVTLLERGRHGVKVTQIGETVLLHARTILNQIEIIRQETARKRGLTVGKIRFGCVANVPPRLLTGILRDFQHRYAEIEVVLFEGTPRELVEWLATGVIDVGTVTNPAGYINAIHFVHDELKVMVSTNHRLAQERVVTIEQLTQEQLIGPKIEYGVLAELLVNKDIMFPPLRYAVSTRNTIFAVVRENLGSAFILNMLIEPDMQGISVLSLQPGMFVDIYLASYTRSPAIEAFLSCASSWARAHGYLPD